MPWLTAHVENFVHSLEETGKFPDEIMMSYFEEAEATHIQTVQTEKQRKENVRLEKEKMEREKLEDK